MSGMKIPRNIERKIFYAFSLPKDVLECSYHCKAQSLLETCVYFIYEDSTCFIGSEKQYSGMLSLKIKHSVTMNQAEFKLT